MCRQLGRPLAGGSIILIGLDDGRRIVDRAQVCADLKAAEPVLRAVGVDALWLFGSVARGDAVPESDVDVAVDMTPDAALGVRNRIQVELERRLGRTVGLTEAGRMKPYILQTARQDAIAIFGDVGDSPMAHRGKRDRHEDMQPVIEYIDGIMGNIAKMDEIIADNPGWLDSDEMPRLSVERLLARISEGCHHIPRQDRDNLERIVDWNEVAEIGNQIRHYYEVITADHVKAYVAAVRKLTGPLTRLRANITKRRDRSESPLARRSRGRK